MKRSLIALSVVVGLFSLLGLTGQPPEAIPPATGSAAFPGNRLSHTYYLQGLNHAYRNESADALKAFERAQKYDPESAMIAYQIGKMQLELGEVGSGVKTLTTAAELGKDNFEIQRYVAQVFLSVGQFGQAKTYLERALKLNVKWSDGYRILATIYEEEGNPLEAARTLERLLEHFPADSYLHLNVTRLYEQAQRPEEAVRHLESIRELALDEPELFLFIANIYSKAGRYDEAIENYRLYLLGNPDADRATVPLLAAYGKGGRLPDAISYFEERVAENPTSVSLRLLLGKAHLLNGQEKRAVEVWEEAIGAIPESDPDRIPKLLKLHYQIASHHEQKEDYEAAISTLQQAAGYPLSEVSDILLVHFRLGILQRLVGNYEDSAASFVKVLETIESLDEAKRAFPGAREMAKNARYSLAANYDLLGRDEEAEAELKKALEAAPDFSEANNYLAYFYAVRGKNLDEALELIGRALEKERSNAAFIDTLGWIYFKLERHEEALEKLIEADSLMDDPVIADHLGDTFGALGQTERAVEAWERSLEMARREAEKNGGRELDPSYRPEEVERKLEEAGRGRRPRGEGGE